MRTVMTWVVGAAMLVSAAGVAEARKQHPAYTILGSALNNRTDPSAVARALAALDRMAVQRPKDAAVQYARGRVLSMQGKTAAALAAYRKAVKLDPRLSAAYYNSGVLLVRSGRTREALVQFHAATRADPRAVDAYYNAGQVYYNLKKYRKALAQWSKAMAVAPNDFYVVKKVLQAQMALGLYRKAHKTRARLFAMHNRSTDPRIRGLKSVVIDQFFIRGYHVYVFETFKPRGNLYYVYTFKLTQSGRVKWSVSLESSAVIRSRGVPYVIGIQDGRTHFNTGVFYKRMPSYKALKKAVVAIIARHDKRRSKAPVR